MRALLVLIHMAANIIAHYKILEGKLHKGGSVRLEVVHDPDRFIVKLNFDIKKKALIPIPHNYLQGEYTMELPKQFRNENGYRELEALGSMDIPRAKLNFLERVQMDGHPGAYKVQILTTNGKSENEIIYHPSLPGAGWFNVKIKYKGNVPLLNDYEIVAELEQ